LETLPFRRVTFCAAAAHTACSFSKEKKNLSGLDGAHCKQAHRTRAGEFHGTSACNQVNKWYHLAGA
jgi:hypothetical protein